MELRRRPVDLAPLEQALAALEVRLRQSEREIAELRGELRAERDGNREARLALRSEIDRIVELLRGPQGAGGFDTMIARWQAAAEAPAPAPAELEAVRKRLSWYDEQHGAGISQEEMIRRNKERDLNGQ
jgi:hypothetical protein